MIFIGVGYLAAWLVISLLGFLKFSDPRRQVLFSGSLIAVAVGFTFGVLRSVELGGFVFGIGVIAALVRFVYAWRRLPVTSARRPH
ncbi:hypothetical protein [Streptomyces bluensis]|uniref:hypothetical protein n=1 Tax=Streptomyces bluensis TaxID=33897 RepID=UPI00332E9D23